jgi:hyperosmotically inducible periplasmic protein
MKRKLSYALAVVGLVLLPILVSTPGCTTPEERRSPEAYVDDSTLSAKIKSDLLRDPIVPGTEVNVTTHQRQVQLTGYVGTEEEKERAARIAGSVAGVLGVRNELVVRTGR